MNKFRKIAGKINVGFATVMAALAVAMTTTPMLALAAPADPGAAIEAEVTGAKATISTILIVLAGVVGMFILWSYLKKAR